MRDDAAYPQIPNEYEKWMAVYFRNRLTSAYADATAGEPPADMAALLARADAKLSAPPCLWPENPAAAA